MSCALPQCPAALTGHLLAELEPRIAELQQQLDTAAECCIRQDAAERTSALEARLQQLEGQQPSTSHPAARCQLGIIAALMAHIAWLESSQADMQIKLQDLLNASSPAADAQPAQQQEQAKPQHDVEPRLQQLTELAHAATGQSAVLLGRIEQLEQQAQEAASLGAAAALDSTALAQRVQQLEQQPLPTGQLDTVQPAASWQESIKQLSAQVRVAAVHDADMEARLQQLSGQLQVGLSAAQQKRLDALELQHKQLDGQLQAVVRQLPNLQQRCATVEAEVQQLKQQARAARACQVQHLLSSSW